MTAIITSKFRVLNAENFKEDVSDSNTSVYVGIGKSDAWSLTTSDTTDTIPFLPKDTIDDVGEAYQNLIGLKRITSSEISHVIARYTWTSGASYVPWDSADPDIFDKPFYVITSEFKVYKCIRAGGASSTIQPVQTLTAPQSESDGYVWKYMYTLSVADAEKFLTISYMPVKTVSLDFASDADADDNLDEADFAQYLNQKNSRDSANVAGIERVVVTAGGTGYTSAPTVTITGDGTGAAATATVANGVVTAVNITNKGTNYTVADITFSGGGGSDAGARAVISPLGGHGVDPVRELGAFYTAINTQLNGSQDGDLTVGNDFRQVCLIKNPYEFGTTDRAIAPTLKALKSLDFTAATDVTSYQVDELLVGQTSGAQAYIVEINASMGLVYIHQNSKTGYANFEASEQVLGQTSNNTGQLETEQEGFLGDPDIQPGSGQMIFLENRDPINRTTTQIEDIKIIIEF
jgi:hypothetical protein